MKISRPVIAFLTAVLFPGYSHADGPSAFLLGDLGRAELAENTGVTIEAVFTFDTVSVVSGGSKRGSDALENFDLTALLDTEKAGLWSGGRFFTYVLANTGTAPSAKVGDIQATDNIESDESIKLYEAWYEHWFDGDVVSVLLGLHDYNSEFNVLDLAGPLINSSFGIEPDISQVGPSIFPATSPAARIHIQATERLSLLTGIYDGVPGSPTNPRGTHIIVREKDGVFIGSELALSNDPENPAEYYKVAAGGWYHTAEFEDYAGRIRQRNGGGYLIGETRVITETDPNQGLGIFAQIGFADAARNQINRYFGGGLNYTGLIPGRDDDITAFGVASALNGDGFRDSVVAGGEPRPSRAETALELTHRIAVTPWFTVQPDVQYVVHPGMTRSLDDAIVLTLRAEIVF